MENRSIKANSLSYNSELQFFNLNSGPDELIHMDVIFCSRDTWLSKQIRRFTRSKFSHVAILLKYDKGTFIVDSQRNGTNIKEFSVWMREYKYDITVVRPDYTLLDYSPHDTLKRIHEVMGVTGYDFRSLLITQPLYLLTGQWLGRKNERALKRMYCSEFVAYCHFRPKFWKYSPGKLYDYFKNSGKFRLLDI